MDVWTAPKLLLNTRTNDIGYDFLPKEPQLKSDLVLLIPDFLYQLIHGTRFILGTSYYKTRFVHLQVLHNVSLWHPMYRPSLSHISIKQKSVFMF